MGVPPSRQWRVPHPANGGGYPHPADRGLPPSARQGVPPSSQVGRQAVPLSGRWRISPSSRRKVGYTILTWLEMEQHSEYLLRGGRYISCVHAGGLSCLKFNSINFLFNSRCIFILFLGHSIMTRLSDMDN